jgi:hypothetical protein
VSSDHEGLPVATYVGALVVEGVIILLIWVVERTFG